MRRIKAKWLIGIFSFVVFAVVVTLGKVKLPIQVSFNVHVFAIINAIINSVIAIILVLALMAVKQRKYLLHKKFMQTALILSILFLVSYIAHHLLAGEAKYGDVNMDGKLDDLEKIAAGNMRYVYYVLLATHIFLATVTLPFILYTAYRGLTAQFVLHKKLSRIIFPLWLYVAVTGPMVYMMISPFYR